VITPVATPRMLRRGKRYKISQVFISMLTVSNWADIWIKAPKELTVIVDISL